jgi:hypothetical protein
MFQFFNYAILAIVLVVFFIVASKNKSKWGINLKRVYCPVCHFKQPLIRMPATGEQALWGGTTCPKCHTKLDKYGNIIP